MVVEELVAVLGLRAKGFGEAKKFVKALEDARRAANGLDKGFRASGLGNVTRDFDRAAAAARRFREEAAKASRVRGGSYSSGGPGGGAYGARRGGYGSHGGYGSGKGGGLVPLIAGAGMGPLAAAGGAYLTGRAIGRMTKDAMDFERSLITVGKATDTSGESLQRYGAEIQQLSRETGKGQNDLASILSAAGFAGRPQNELMRFTEFGAKAAVAWQTTTEETGQALAEIGNIYGANQDRIEVIADAINRAADSSASKEPDLLDFIRRAGASAKEAGLSAEQILPFAAAMKEVGVRTDTAATGYEALLNVLKLGDGFSKKAGEGLAQLGINSTKMRKQFVAKPLETMLGLLEKIQKVSDPLKKAEIMTNLFGKEYQDDIAKLLNALPQIRKYIDMLSNPANFKGDVRKQFQQQLNFDVSKIDRAAASIEVLSTRLGNYQKIVLGFGADAFNNAFDRVEKGINQVSVDPDTSDAKLREINGMPPLISGQQFSERFGTGPMSVPLERRSFMHRNRTGLPTFTRLPGKKYAMDYQVAPEPYYPPTFGSTPGSSFGIGGAKSKDWVRDSMQQTVNNVTNNSNVGNDQRQQSVTVNQTVNGVPGVAQAAASGVTGALSSMGSSLVKGSSAATGSDTAP